MFKKIKKTTQTIQQEINTEEYKIYLKLVEKWEKKINKQTQKNAKIIDYKNEVLTIKTKNPTWKNEIVFMEESIKKNSQQQKPR
ncbi:hypothetical protein CL659_05685 [bacterium]|nr:hypothetical protein [bacterium]|tara:strand:- start:345 stop:596 length:252 start_codon:yes stop_codon:yes gene_type:complete